MGCAMSRKITSTTTINSQTTTPPQWDINRYSSSTSSCSSGFVDYISAPLPRSSPTLSQGSRLIKPERVYSPIDSPPQGYTYTPRKVPLEDKASSALSGINSLFRSKKVYYSGELTEIPLSNTPHTVLKTSGNGTPLSAQRAEKRWKPTPPPEKSKTNPKRSKKHTGAQSTSSPTESKLEISWPTSCHHNPGLLPSAVALGYPYPYPFPLSTVPSDPDLVATAESDGQKDAAGVYCGYYGYDYECLVEASKEGAKGAVRLEIRPGRNPKWEKELVEPGEEVSLQGN